MTMVDLQKKIAEGDARLKQQQSLYEAVRSDRNLYSKNLIESQDEIAEMKRKFKIMNHQIEQLKEEIGNKDQAFVKEHIERTKAEKEKEAQKNELMRVKRQVFTSEAAMKNFEAERASSIASSTTPTASVSGRRRSAPASPNQLRRRGEAAPASPAARRETVRSYQV